MVSLGDTTISLHILSTTTFQFSEAMVDGVLIVVKTQSAKIFLNFDIQRDGVLFWSSQNSKYQDYA